MRDGVLCAADLPVRLTMAGPVCQLAMVLPAKEWAERLGIAWDTVRQRRYRGDSWTEAFQPYLRRTPFNGAPVPACQRKQIKTTCGALQMKKLEASMPEVVEVSVPEVAHVIVTGVSGVAKAAVMRRFQEVLQQEFGAAVSVALPAEQPAEASDDVRKALWLVSSV